MFLSISGASRSGSVDICFMSQLWQYVVYESKYEFHLNFSFQDIAKKYNGEGLHNFYNIVLERPKDDPDGYDVLFVDAAAKVRPQSK